MAPIKVGLMGYGFSTKCFHLPYILPNPDLTVHAFLQRKAAPTDTTEPGIHCTIDYPHAKHYRDAASFFSDPDIELVVVCTAVASHAEYAEMALKAGKHVVVEKPFTQSVAEADRLISVAKESGKILTVFQNRRYDSDFRTLLKLVENNAFGEITDCDIHYDANNPAWLRPNANPGPGDGMLFGLGTHTIDQALILFGAPRAVWCTTRALKEGSKANDAFIVQLQYGGGGSSSSEGEEEEGEKWKENLLVTVRTTIVSPVPMSRMPKYAIRGRHGAYFKNGEDVQVEHFYSGIKVTDAKFGVEPKELHGYLSTTEESKMGKYDGVYESEKGNYESYYRDVVKAIRGEAEVKVKPEESRMGLRIIESAVESTRTGRTVDFTP